jgi:hypothetical protein
MTLRVAGPWPSVATSACRGPQPTPCHFLGGRPVSFFIVRAGTPERIQTSRSSKSARHVHGKPAEHAAQSRGASGDRRPRERTRQSPQTIQRRAHSSTKSRARPAMSQPGAHHRTSAAGATRPSTGGWVILIKGASRWLRSQWRCLKHTGGAHEIDLYTGVCRYCGAHLKERL